MTVWKAIPLCSALLFISNAAMADCKSIANPAARLACFDKATAPPASAKKTSPGDPATEAAKRAIIATRSRLFKDADSLKDVSIGTPFTCVSGVDTCVCMEANGKTAAGGYSGIQLLLVKIKGPAETEQLGEVFKPEICGSKLSPFPQMNGKR